MGTSLSLSTGMNFLGIQTRREKEKGSVLRVKIVIFFFFFFLNKNGKKCGLFKVLSFVEFMD